jgi:hypothetical protein
VQKHVLVLREEKKYQPYYQLVPRHNRPSPEKVSALLSTGTASQQAVSRKSTSLIINWDRVTTGRLQKGIRLTFANG